MKPYVFGFSDWVDPRALNPCREHKRLGRFDYLDLPYLPGLVLAILVSLPSALQNGTELLLVRSLAALERQGDLEDYWTP